MSDWMDIETAPKDGTWFLVNDTRSRIVMDAWARHVTGAGAQVVRIGPKATINRHG